MEKVGNDREFLDVGQKVVMAPSDRWKHGRECKYHLIPGAITRVIDAGTERIYQITWHNGAVSVAQRHELETYDVSSIKEAITYAREIGMSLEDINTVIYEALTEIFPEATKGWAPLSKR